MSYTARVSYAHRLAGKTYTEQRDITGEHHKGTSQSVAAAKAGALTTRTDDNTGELTMAASHGITTGQRLDLYWEGGSRRGITVGTVAGNAVPIDLGSGDNLPTESTEITAMVPVEESLVITGDDLKLLVASSTKRGQIVLEDSGGEELHIPLEAGSVYDWHTLKGSTNPIAGDSITKAFLSHEDSAAASTMSLGVLHD